jgi:hypothetical protein
MIARRVRWWPLVATALTIGIASCSSDAASTSGTGPTTSSASAATGAAASTTIAGAVPNATAVVAGKPAPEATVTPPVDGAALLATSFAGLAAGYHFTTTVTVGDAVSVVADGDRVGADTRLTITSNGGTVSYLIMQAGSWASTAGGAWEQMDTPPASADPIDALRTPTSVTVTSTDAASTHLSVAVPAASLGVAGAADATLDVAIAGTILQEIVYQTTVNGQPAEVQAVIGPLTDTTPITAPA